MLGCQEFQKLKLVVLVQDSPQVTRTNKLKAVSEASPVLCMGDLPERHSRTSR